MNPINRTIDMSIRVTKDGNISVDKDSLETQNVNTWLQIDGK